MHSLRQQIYFLEQGTQINPITGKSSYPLCVICRVVCLVIQLPISPAMGFYRLSPVETYHFWKVGWLLEEQFTLRLWNLFLRLFQWHNYRNCLKTLYKNHIALLISKGIKVRVPKVIMNRLLKSSLLNYSVEIIIASYSTRPLRLWFMNYILNGLHVSGATMRHVELLKRSAFTC